MKTWVVILGLGAVGLGLYLFFKRDSGLTQAPPSGTGGGITEFSTVPEDIVGGTPAGGTAGTPAPSGEFGATALEAPPSQRIDNPNNVVGQNKTIQEGFSTDVIPSIPLQFLGVQPNPLTGQPQAVFQRPTQAHPAQAVLNIGGQLVSIEQIPAGAASTSPNVVFLPAEFGGTTTGGGTPLSPGDPGYERALAAARAKVQAAISAGGVGQQASSSSSSSKKSSSSGKSAERAISEVGKKVKRLGGLIAN